MDDLFSLSESHDSISKYIEDIEEEEGPANKRSKDEDDKLYDAVRELIDEAEPPKNIDKDVIDDALDFGLSQDTKLDVNQESDEFGINQKVAYKVYTKDLYINKKTRDVFSYRLFFNPGNPLESMIFIELEEQVKHLMPNNKTIDVDRNPNAKSFCDRCKTNNKHVKCHKEGNSCVPCEIIKECIEKNWDDIKRHVKQTKDEFTALYECSIIQELRKKEAEKRARKRSKSPR